MNAGLFPKPLHVLFACITGVKHSVQAASFKARVIIFKMQLFKRDLSRERPGLGTVKGSELSCTKFAPSSVSA